MGSDTIGLPLLLLLATFGAYSTVLKTIEMLDSTRNMILGVGNPPAPLSVRKLLLWSDWIPTRIGFTFVMLILVVMFFGAPKLVIEMYDVKGTTAPPWLAPMIRDWHCQLSRLDFACYSLGIFGLLTVIGNVIGSAQDLRLMCRLLAQSEHKPNRELPRRADPPDVSG